MKIGFLTLILVFALSGCSIKYLQYYRTASVDSKKVDTGFVFENDTVRITYTFWANGGVMSFNIFNKMNKPLYIDWRRSSFIINSNNVYYYNDTIVSNSYNKFYYNTYLSLPAFSSYSRLSGSRSLVTHQITTTFLPPHTQIVQTVPYIVGSNIKDWNGYETLYEKRKDKPKKTTRIFDKNFSKDNSPIIFRNFLTLSVSEDFRNSFSVDNGFYVAEMQAMDVRNFRIDRGDQPWVFYYKKGGDFYLEQ